MKSTPKNKYRVTDKVVWIKLTQGRETCVDLAAWPRVSKHRWFAHRRIGLFYAATNIPRAGGQQTLSLHQLLTGYQKTDHKDHDGLNNRRRNLRRCSHSQNRYNSVRRSDNRSGFKGVSQRKSGRWSTYISAEKRRINLGCFDTVLEAASAYNTAAKKHHGRFACINL